MESLEELGSKVAERVNSIVLILYSGYVLDLASLIRLTIIYYNKEGVNRPTTKPLIL